MSKTNDGAMRPSRRDVLRATALTGAGLAAGGLPIGRARAAAADTSAPFTPTDMFFNSHHSPIGAYSTFTIGFPGANGGFGIEQKLPGSQSTFIGVQKNGAYLALPFFDTSTDTGVTPYATTDVTRDFRVASDTFTTADFSFTLYSPVRSIPDPTGENTAPFSPPLTDGRLLNISTAGAYPIEDVLLPAIFAELVVDNTAGSDSVTAFFAVTGGNATLLDTANPAVGFGTAPSLQAIATNQKGAFPFTAESLGAAMSGQTGSGSLGGFAVAIPAGRKVSIPFALCFHYAGATTTGSRTQSFWYTQYYADIEAVVAAATTGLRKRIASFANDNKLVDGALISNDQKFLLSQAIHSYYGNTALLQDDTDKSPWWLVLEGQYQYMNTFDLTVDQQFFELGMNPWTTRNVLEHSATYYSYQSGTELVATQPTPTGPGGISFTHDMGQWPTFSPDGFSAYEQPNIDVMTFSYMTGEQLTNWILLSGVYVAQTGDSTYFNNNVDNFVAVLHSLVHRDSGGGASARDGIESYNSTRCGTGGEITTYDSVGPGLTDAVGNTYLGGKTWASYVILEFLLTLAGKKELARTASSQAALAAAKITSFQQSAGYIASNVYNGETIPVIPVIEGLVYPYFAGRQDAVSADGPYPAYVAALGKHLTTVLQPGICLTPDNGWMLDSMSANTWLSKIFLNEFVGRQVLGLDIRANTDNADAASVYWLTNSQSAINCFSDQIKDQVAFGSEYYPRGVTSILWLQEPANT